MRHQDHRRPPAQRPDALLEQPLRHLRVHRGNRVVQQVDVRLAVERPRHCQSRLLSSRKRDALLSDYSLLLVPQGLEVLHEAGLRQSAGVLGLVERPSEEDVVADGVGEDDGLLLDVGDGAADLEAAGVVGDVLEDGPEEPAFAGADLAGDAVEVSGSEVVVNVLEGGGVEILFPVPVEMPERDISFWELLFVQLTK